jgi:ABC-2 type transport system ATP-binding protein
VLLDCITLASVLRMAMTELAVEAAGLRKSFGAVTVLRAVDLQVPPGSVFALLGPNGAGKTTVVRILSTLQRADGGRARVAGFDVAAEPGRVRRAISLTGQSAAVDDLQTGTETLRMMSRLWGLSRAQARQRAAELLEQFGLAEAGQRRIVTYSGGMRRRLDLAASLVGRPAVIFLDEPTTGLDVRSRQAMWAAITDLASGGATVFLTTQYLEEADQLAGRISIIDAGRVVAEGTPRELKRLVGTERLSITLAGPGAFAGAVTALGARVIRADPARLSLSLATDGTAAGVRALLDEIDPGRQAVRHFTVASPTLDDVFLALTGRDASRPAAATRG